MKSVKEAAEVLFNSLQVIEVPKRGEVDGRTATMSQILNSPPALTESNFSRIWDLGHAHAISELEDITTRYNALSLANAELEARLTEAQKSITLANENKKLRQMADEPIEKKESAK